jgi:hypothetical protein
MKISLTNRNEFDDFQDLAYTALGLIRDRRIGFLLRIFDLQGTDRVLAESWIEQIEEIVGPIKENDKANELHYRLRGIMTTTNYYLSLYQKEKNISTFLRYCGFKPADIQFKVVFSLEDEKVEIDLPKEYAWALGEGYRLILALEKGDFLSFASFLDDYGKTPYDKERLRTCFHHLEEFPRCIDNEKEDFLVLYEKIFLEEKQ